MFHVTLVTHVTQLRVVGKIVVCPKGWWVSDQTKVLHYFCVPCSVVKLRRIE